MINFYGNEEKLLIKMLSMLHLHESHSICDNFEVSREKLLSFCPRTLQFLQLLKVKHSLLNLCLIGCLP